MAGDWQLAEAIAGGGGIADIGLPPATTLARGAWQVASVVGVGVAPESLARGMNEALPALAGVLHPRGHGRL